MASFATTLNEAVHPLVLALDVGSTASRGMIYDPHGRPVGKRAKVAHRFTSGSDGTSVIDPDQVVEELSTIIDTLTGALDGQRVAGVALDTFASSLVVVDSGGDPLTPCITYADGRCARQVEELRAELTEEAVQQRTGARIHSSYWPARLRWLAQEHPDVVSRAAHYLSLGDYVLRSLTGVLATGTSTASWTGLVDRQTADWSPEIVAAAGILLEQLPPIGHLDQPLEIDAGQVAVLDARWPALTGASWFATVADGFAANVGLGAHDETTIGASCATSGALRVVVREMPDELPPGLWCYRVSHDRALLGGALNDVGRALAWADATLRTDDLPDGELSGALTAEPGPTTPLVLPFFTGERSTGWAADARAVLTGVGAGTEPVEVYRGVVEGLALSYARIAVALRQVAPQAGELVCGGRVTSDRAGAPPGDGRHDGHAGHPGDNQCSTLHGSALLALETLAPDVARVVPDRGETLSPEPGRRGYYADRMRRFEQVYDALFA